MTKEQTLKDCEAFYNGKSITKAALKAMDEWANQQKIELLEKLFPGLVDDKYMNPHCFSDAQKIYNTLKNKEDVDDVSIAFPPNEERE